MSTDLIPQTTQAAFTANMSEQVLKLRGEGNTWADIGTALGVHETSAMRWYKRAAAEQLKQVQALREDAFYSDLASIQDKIDALELKWAPTPEKLPMLAAIVKLIETKAKFLRYADLKFTTDAAGKSKEELLDELATHARTMGARLDEALREREVIDVGEG